MLYNGTIIANRYEIIEKIGAGGTADVYRAKCHKLNRFVAVKVLKREFSEDSTFISKFRIEAQSAAGMAHANIVNVFDVGDENGIHYIVMELVEGITLKQYIDNKGALEYKEAVSVAIQIAQGIEAAHKHNIIHRDIKPQNIIISQEGKVKVTDFGIAKVTSTDTVNSMAMGSVHYISPEQARGGFSNITSDIYSFGITLYEMCTGRVPFDGENTVSVALKHIQNEITPPSAYNPNIPVSVEKIILKCTQKRVDMRYQSATDVIADLKRALINPYEDFVNLGNGFDTSPTVFFTPDEMNQINARKQTVAEPDIKPYFDNGYSSGDLEVKMVPDDSIDLTHIYEDDTQYEEHHYTSDNDEDEEEAEDMAVRDDNKLDKIMLWLGIGVAVVIVFITLAVVFKAFVTFNGLSEQETSTSPKQTVETVAENEGIKVPPLVGLTAEEAQATLNGLGLGYMTNPSQLSDVMPKGYVMEQSVEDGVYVKPNTQIFVTISMGPKSFDLIGVVSYSEAVATEELEALDLVVFAEYEYNNEFEQGVVFKTEPVAGAKVQAGDTIKIFVSRGKEHVECEVPNLLDMDESAAREALDKAGLVAQLGGTASSSTVAAGRVVAQSYPEGTKLPAGTIVEIVLSSGSDNKMYHGSVTLIKDWYTAEQAPEGFDETTGIKEAYAVLRQSKDNENYTQEILPYTNINMLGDSYLLEFSGIVEGVKEASVDFYVRFTWTDPATGEVRTQEGNVMSTTAFLTEVTN